ncbi:MAG: alpha/beta hydrolase-fold protein [Cyclobacteriaceae bacterium]|jgi:predicted alpha/beta superfamily hydrolase|nr:alpha/beta hydrolase-fold protein [Cyclobacteriaceae bacterium]
MRFFFLFLSLSISGVAVAQLPKVAGGKLIRHENFSSRYVAARHVDVWLPEQYAPNKKYTVLYMHDGQMLFDSTLTWNKQEWMADETAASLIKNKKVKPFIIVGIWNGGAIRHSEYFPQKAFEKLPKHQQDSLYQTFRNNGAGLFAAQVQSDNYLKFVVEELKPFIDKNYSTHSDSKYTFIAGSSMGGLISMYAVCEYPNVFGGAACLSTHWPGVFTLDKNPIPAVFFSYLNEKLPKPANNKFYFDYGTATLDALYPGLQKQVDEILTRKGYTQKLWITKAFPGEDHSERAWQKRLYLPFTFLLK